MQRVPLLNPFPSPPPKRLEISGAENMKEMRYTSKSNAGFTLIEMMIAVTVGLFILGAVSAEAINSARSSRANDRTSELQTNGRYALDVLRRDVQHAGNTGLTPASGVVVVSAPGVVVTNDCAVGFSLQLGQPVWGVNDSNAGVTACIPNANYSRGDILAIRYADMNALTVQNAASAPTAAPVSAANNDIYFRSAYDGNSLFQVGVANPTAVGVSALASLPSPMQDQLLKSYVYYIGPNTTANDGIPALYRLGLRLGVMTPELVASGIENLQVRYGVLDTSGNTRYYEADGVNGVPSGSWPLVNSVRVWLLARNSGSERNEAYSNTTSYPMGDVNYTPTVGTNNQFRRQLYMATIQLRN
jgi:type IV pilus assembly protein PilW